MRRRSARILIVALFGSSLAAIASGPAGAISPDLVISQVYGGGGNPGATYTHDFVELYNRGVETVSVEGWSVQYASSAGVSWIVTPLDGQIPPGAHYLVQHAQGAAGTTPLPEPDVVGNTATSSAAGKVALVTKATSLTCGVDCNLATGVRDFVGYGATANDFEGTGPAPAPSNTTAALRAADGVTDTDDNSADFSATAPNPRNCGAPCEPIPDTTKPVSRVVRPDHGVTYKRGALLGLRGTASDAGGSGLKRVHIALRRNMTNGTCKWWTGSGWKARGCSLKLFLNANGTATWTKGLGSRLPRSRGTTTRSYTVFSRATDNANNVESTFTKARNANTFEVR